jgi:DUF3011 family protein
MWRTMGLLASVTIVVSAIPGCVDPYYRGHHRSYSDQAYYDDEDYYGRSDHRHDEHRNDYRLPTLVCASKDGRASRCYTDFPIQRADVDKRYSGSPCEYGRSWGYDQNEVWVDRGCRARFVLTPAGRWR